MRPHHQPTAIAILGGDQVVVNALLLLLESEGYKVRRLESYPTGLMDDLLEGVDLVLLAPGLSSGVHDALLSVVRGNPKMAQMPILTLSTAFEETPSDQAGIVPWPWRLEDLRRAIEFTLTPTTGGEG